MTSIRAAARLTRPHTVHIVTGRTRQLLGIKSQHDEGQIAVMGDDGGMHAQRGVGSAALSAESDDSSNAHLYPRVTSFRSRRSTLTDGQQDTWDRLWDELGTQARPASPDGEPVEFALDTGGLVRPPRTRGAGDRLRYRHVDAGDGHRRAQYRRRRRRGLPARSGPAVESAIDREHVTNIRLIRGDGLDVLERHVRAQVR